MLWVGAGPGIAQRGDYRYHRSPQSQITSKQCLPNRRVEDFVHPKISHSQSQTVSLGHGKSFPKSIEIKNQLNDQFKSNKIHETSIQHPLKVHEKSMKIHFEPWQLHDTWEAPTSQGGRRGGFGGPSTPTKRVDNGYSMVIVYGYIVYGYIVYGYIVYGYIVYGYIVYGYIVYGYIVYGYIVYGYIVYGYIVYGYI